MIQNFKGRLRRFRRIQPGHRFQDYYHQHRRNRRRHRRMGRVIRIVLGILIVLAGIFFMPAPGPGSLIVILGLGILASEFLIFARFMDWCEVTGRRLIDFVMDIWNRSPMALKVVYSLVLLAGATIAAYGAYTLLFG